MAAKPPVCFVYMYTVSEPPCIVIVTYNNHVVGVIVVIKI